MRISFAALAVLLCVPSQALAYGESQDGFPNWAERVVHEWMNRSRADPQTDLADCGTNCPEAACYQPIAPLGWDLRLNRAARFHSDNMAKQGFFSHDSKCTLVANLDALYPASCDGSPSCACVGGTASCNPTCTKWSDRVGLFGIGTDGEIIASPSDPDQAFYLWLFEPFTKTACAYDQGPPTNGHRWHILKQDAAVGVGVSLDGGDSVGDFGGSPTTQRIPSAAHYPRQAESVEAWASWYDTAAPKSALVNLDGSCQPMTLARGSGLNGAYKATLSGVGSGCHRYYFIFEDGNGDQVTYPDTGSLGLGPAGSCADWDASRPPAGAGCDCTPTCGSNECGEDGCGGSCGACAAGETCDAGQCVAGSSSSSSSGGTTSSSGGAGGEGEGGSGGVGSSDGCGCRLDGRGEAATGAPALLLALGLLRRRRARRRG